MTFVSYSRSIAWKIPSPVPSPQRGEGAYKKELLSPTEGEGGGEGARCDRLSCP